MLHEGDGTADVRCIPAPGGPVRFDFGTLRGITPRLRMNAMRAVEGALERLPTRSAYRDFDSIRGMLRRVAGSREAPIDEITPELLRAHDASLPAGRRYLSARLAVALRRWHAARAGGLSPDLLDWLDRQTIEPHAAGDAVRTLSTTQGALDAAERDAVLAALHEGAASGTVRGADYAMCLLVVVLGLRPMQVALLKVCDLRPPSEPEAFAADLLVPRVKQRDGSRPRGLLTPRGLVETFADVLRAQRSRAREHAAALGVAVPDVPLFPSPRLDRGQAPGFVGHLSAATVSRRVALVLNRLDALPNRDDENGAHLFALRMRRTFATLLSVEGCGLAEISALLDHGGSRQGLAYIEATPALGARLGRTMTGSLGELAAAFAAPNAYGRGADGEEATR